MVTPKQKKSSNPFTRMQRSASRGGFYTIEERRAAAMRLQAAVRGRIARRQRAERQARKAAARARRQAGPPQLSGRR